MGFGAVPTSSSPSLRSARIRGTSTSHQADPEGRRRDRRVLARAGRGALRGALDTVVPVSSPEVAEAAKLLENIFRSVNIALVNEMKIILDRMGIDVWEVIEAAKTKPFGFMPFYPGPGLGGHCIPLDPFYLSWRASEFGVWARFIELAGEVNASMPRYVVQKTLDALNDQGKAAQRFVGARARSQLQARHRRRSREPLVRDHGAAQRRRERKSPTAIPTSPASRPGRDHPWVMESAPAPQSPSQPTTPSSSSPPTPSSKTRRSTRTRS